MNNMCHHLKSVISALLLIIVSLMVMHSVAETDYNISEKFYNSALYTVEGEYSSLFTINDLNIDQIENNSDRSWWASEFHYPKGYIESIRVNRNNEELPEIAIVDASLNKVVYLRKGGGR